MLLLIIKILLWSVVIRYSIALVSYHINHCKKTNHRGGGNWRMPKDVALAFNEIIEKYRNGLYYTKDCILTGESNQQEGLVINAIIAPKTGFIEVGNRKRQHCPQLKTGNNDFLLYSKMYNSLTGKYLTKNNNADLDLPGNNIPNINNLKISEAAILSPE
jgi:hypothetical protein